MPWYSNATIFSAGVVLSIVNELGGVHLQLQETEWTAVRTAKLVTRCLVILSLVLTVVATPVGAENEISIPFDDIIFGSPGEVVELAREPVDADLVGQTCEISVEAENQSSVHIGNDLLITTASSRAVVVGVEDTANGGTLQTFEVVLGPTVLVHIRMGQSGISSLGFSLSIDCDGALGSSSQTADATTTTVAPTTVPETAPDTTAPPATIPTTAVPTTTVLTATVPADTAPTATAPADTASVDTCLLYTSPSPRDRG